MLLVGSSLSSTSPIREPPLKEPIGYTQVFSGCDTVLNMMPYQANGAWLYIWQPIPPEGYVSLGDVVTSTWGAAQEPSKSSIWCVRKDLTTSGQYSEHSVWCNTDDQLWKDWGWFKDSSIWDLKPQGNSVDEDNGWFPLVAGTFRAHMKRDEQPPLREARMLRIKLEKDLEKFPTEAPAYNRKDPPYQGQIVGSYKHGTTVLPYTAFFPPTEKTCLEYIANPFYRLTKTATFCCVEYWSNNGPASQSEKVTVKTGFSKEQSTTMTHEAGVSVSASFGIKALGAEVDTTLNYSFTHAHTSNFTEYSEHQVEKTIEVPPWSVVCMWSKRLVVVATREDDEVDIVRVETNANERLWQTGDKYKTLEAGDTPVVGERFLEKRIPLE